MNRSVSGVMVTVTVTVTVMVLQRLVVCLEESLYIHNIRDMKVIHVITCTPPNPTGLIALSADTTNFCLLAYPGHSHTGQLQVGCLISDKIVPYCPRWQVFDAETLACRVVIPAHEGQLAALQLSRTNTRVATASTKGTVIRVFDTRWAGIGGEPRY